MPFMPVIMHTRDGDIVNAHLIYDATQNPFAIRMEFDPGDGTVVTWVVGRDLINEGLCHTYWTGEGDFRIRVRNGWAFVMLVNREGRTIELAAEALRMREFVAATYREVAPGEEPRLIDWGAELERILG